MIYIWIPLQIDTMEKQSPLLSVGTGSRSCYLGFQYYYAYGNTPARDFLEHATSDLDEPSVLVLGCGDIRSWFFTVWRNFNPMLEQRFKGTYFTLNDRSAAVSARNILFLYLCMKLPTDSTNQQKWLFAIWSIWFCHELLPSHEQVLRGALKELLDFSENNWFTEINPLHSIVKFNSPATLTKIRKLWALWYNGELVESVEELLKLRRAFMMEKMNHSNHHEATVGAFEILGTLGMRLNKVEETAVEYMAYLDKGSAFAESLLSQMKSDKTVVNPTFFEKKGVYNIFFSSCPFRCFQQVYKCNLLAMMKAGMHVVDYCKTTTVISSEAFEKFPLLANSFQQFSLWISCTASILHSGEINLKMNFDSSDAFEFAKSCHQQFDLVYASNVIDSVAPPAFILASIELAKGQSYFFSATLLFPNVAETLEKYIEATFGFPSKFLPVICGIRCMNQEGEEYSSIVSSDHIPIDIGNVEKSWSSMREKMLIWKKIKMTPLIFNFLSECPDISHALSSCFYTCCTSLVEDRKGMGTLKHLCTDTAIRVLLSFTNRLDPNFTISHTFWQCFCSHLRKYKKLRTFLSSIQSQAIICGLHLHLTVDTDTCPFCTSIPLSNYFSQMCIEFPLKSVSFANPAFFAITSQNDMDTDLETVLTDSDAHIFDCTTQVSNDTIKIYFLTPNLFTTRRYKFTLVQSIRALVQTQETHIHTSLLKGNLHDYVIHISSSQQSPNRHFKKISSIVGVIAKHCGNGDEFETIIELNQEKPELLTEKLGIKQISLNKIQILCVGHHLLIKYPFPVAYNKLNLQRCKKRRTLTLKAYRSPYQYEKEGQLFHVNPNDPFSFPLVNLDKETFTQPVYVSQYTLEEKRILNTSLNKRAHCLLRVKKMIHFLLEQDRGYFELTLPGPLVFGLIEINHQMVDVHRKTPVVDINFCFTDTVRQEAHDFMLQKLSQTSVQESCIDINFIEESVPLFRAILENFSKKTIQAKTQSANTKPSLMQQCGLESFFKRALVYPLYQDPDRASFEVRCTYCKKAKHDDLKKCSQCRKVSYCSKQCQKNHWSEHKLACSAASTSAFSAPDSVANSAQSSDRPHKQSTASHHKSDSSQSVDLMPCTYCKELTKPENLLKCSRCRKVFYCNKQCQKNHWSKHKLDCIDTSTSTSSAPDSVSNPAQANDQRAANHHKTPDSSHQRHLIAVIIRHLIAVIIRHLIAVIIRHLIAVITRHLIAVITRHLIAVITRHLIAVIIRHLIAVSQ